MVIRKFAEILAGSSIKSFQLVLEKTALFNNSVKRDLNIYGFLVKFAL